MIKIVILTSDIGTGTNLQAIIEAINKKIINGKISAVISDVKDTPSIKRARKYRLPILICPKKEQLQSLLDKLKPDYICLAGWKQIIPDELLGTYPNRILNTHPGLIPDTLDGVVKNPDGTLGLWNKGKMTTFAMQNFLDSKATYAGCSNHFLSSEFDFGKVLGRCFEKIRKNDTVDTLYTRLKKKENQLYVKVLAKLSQLKTVMVIDAGGRGAVLVEKYGQSELVGKILAVPGNDLMSINTDKPVITFPHLKTTSIKEILAIARKEKVDLVDVAQDNAVESGLVDQLTKIGVTALGPTKRAGQIEWDKAWARQFMGKYKIPSPKFYIFKSPKKAIDFVKQNPQKNWFVKASGLAEGKGVILSKGVKETILAIKQMERFGKSGATFLLEECLEGEEFSAFALCDGNNFKIVGYAQDHKRANDGDLGPNTGGMGCVSNPLLVDDEIKKQTVEIFDKTLKALKQEARPYKGILYLGGMVVNNRQVFVIEFNARWGDPEAEVIIPSIQNDLYEVSQAMIKGKIKLLRLKLDQKIRVVVAGCAKGYPVDYSEVLGKRVNGIEEAQNMGVRVYGAGIKKNGNEWMVNGGRVLFVMAEGENILQAYQKAYLAIKKISVEGENLHYRKDIGWRDLDKKSKYDT